MVSFVCDTCQNTFKKNKLQQHAARCPAVFSCIDCSTTFHGAAYMAHTSCVSEVEKYQGKMKARPKKDTVEGKKRLNRCRKPSEWKLSHRPLDFFIFITSLKNMTNTRKETITH